MITFLTSSACLATDKEENSFVESLFQKPLIIGASVSADWNSSSPGKKLALRYVPPTRIRSFSKGGRTGRATLHLIQEADFKDRSIVIGVDLFFWDSTLKSVDKSIEALHRLMKIVSDKKIPLVLGEIPELLPGRQPNRNRLNKEIAAACSQYSLCYLMPFDRLHQKVMREGYLLIDGEKYTLKEIIPDGLHLSDEASDYLADLMQQILSENKKPVKLKLLKM